MNPWWWYSRACRLQRTASRAAKTGIGTRGMRHRVLLNLEEPEDAEGSRRRGNTWNADRGSREETVNLAKLIREKISRKERFCSFELFPTNADGVYQRFFEETKECSAIFYALTWHEESEGTSKERFPTLRCAENFPRNTLLHLTAKGLKRIDAEKILSRALELGIVNIFALQGDFGSYDGDFRHASDLVSFIRERFGQQFSICVAGYPEMHPQSSSKELDLLHLKKKVDAGADFIITQLFFESRLFIRFVEDCRKIGITVPIIPGIFPFTNAQLLERMTSICRAKIPQSIRDAIQKVDDSDEAVMKLGVELSVQLIKEIFKSGLSYGYHLYTLNRSSAAVEVFRQLNEKKEEETEEIVNMRS